MEQKSESKKASKREKWHYLFKMHHDNYIHKYFVNSQLDKIREVSRYKKNIITCPILLDLIISKYLCLKEGKHILTTLRLLDTINNMFENCHKDCPYWEKWLNEWEIVREKNKRKGFIVFMALDPFIEEHDNIFKLYLANDWTNDTEDKIKDNSKGV